MRLENTLSAPIKRNVINVIADKKDEYKFLPGSKEKESQDTNLQNELYKSVGEDSESLTLSDSMIQVELRDINLYIDEEIKE